jgi:hypothetical protein
MCEHVGFRGRLAYLGVELIVMSVGFLAIRAIVRGRRGRAGFETRPCEGDSGVESGCSGGAAGARVHPTRSNFGVPANPAARSIVREGGGAGERVD